MALSIKLAQKRTPNVQPDILFFPQAQAPPTGARRRIRWGQVAPAGTRFQYPENTFQNTPVVGPWPSGAMTLGQQRLNAPPLIITEKGLGHCQLFTIQLQLYRNYSAGYSELMKPLLASSFTS
jgi:hypothetical protein